MGVMAETPAVGLRWWWPPADEVAAITAAATAALAADVGASWWCVRPSSSWMANGERCGIPEAVVLRTLGAETWIVVEPRSACSIFAQSG